MNWIFDGQPLKIRPILWIETLDNKFPVVERNIAEELIFSNTPLRKPEISYVVTLLRALPLVTPSSTDPGLGL